MTTPYQRGLVFEHATRTHLQTEGYDVIRAAGSHTPADLIAIKQGQLLLVQCKLDGRIGPHARNQLLELAHKIDTGIAIVAWKKRGTINPQYRQLTGPGPTDWTDFHTDHIQP
jgi:Holliday junction resolvase